MSPARLLLPLLLCCVLTAPVRSQTDDASTLDRVEVTGSRISYRDLLDTPAISITRPGDYLLLNVVLRNDTRNEEARKQEIFGTVQRMVTAAAARFQIVHGDAYRTTLSRSHHEVDLQEETDRPDASLASVYVRAEIAGDPAGAEKLIQSMIDFVESVDPVGRSEVEPESEAALGMNKPERYRYELIEAIARDVNRVRDVLGTGCTVDIDGLNSRVEWERVSAGELLLYIPYNMMVSGCLPSAAAEP